MEKRYIQLNSGPPVYSAGGGGGIIGINYCIIYAYKIACCFVFMVDGNGRSGRQHPRWSGHLGARVRRGTGRGEPEYLVCVLTGHGDQELRLEFGQRTATSSDRGGLELRLTEVLRGEGGRAARTGRAGASWLGGIRGGGGCSRWAADTTNRPRQLPSRSPGEEGSGRGE